MFTLLAYLTNCTNVTTNQFYYYINLNLHAFMYFSKLYELIMENRSRIQIILYSYIQNKIKFFTTRAEMSSLITHYLLFFIEYRHNQSSKGLLCE